MDILQKYEKEIEAICYVIGTLHYSGLSIKETIRTSVRFLVEQYMITLNEAYLDTALINIQAFLNAGCIYEDEQELFDYVLALYGSCREEMFPKRIYYSKRVKLNHAQVSSMIGRWMPSKANPMKKDELIEDIIHKVAHKQEGNYFYRYYPSHLKNPDSMNQFSDYYELVVRKDECFFYDMANRRYYTFY